MVGTVGVVIRDELDIHEVRGGGDGSGERVRTAVSSHLGVSSHGDRWRTGVTSVQNLSTSRVSHQSYIIKRRMTLHLTD